MNKIYKFSTLAQNYKTNGLIIKSVYKNNLFNHHLIDNNNKIYTDLTSSYSSTSFGYLNNDIKKHLIESLDNPCVIARFMDTNQLNNFSNIINEKFINLLDLNKSKDKYLQVMPEITGAGSINAMFKIMSAWGYLTKNIPSNKRTILFARNNFHGRCMIGSTAKLSEYNKKFMPGINGIDFFNFNDIDSLIKVIKKHNNGKNIAGIIIEPIQGEGGIITPKNNFLLNVKQITNEFNILFGADEIQTGLGRCGSLLACSRYNIKPDIVSIGKSLGGGFIPISATIASKDIMSVIKEGEHGSTFGGYPLGASIASFVLNYISNQDIINKTLFLEKIFIEKLNILKNKYKFIKDIRGIGLFYGIEFEKNIDANFISQKLLNEYYLITKYCGNNTIRISPIFCLTEKEIIDIFYKINKCFIMI